MDKSLASTASCSTPSIIIALFTSIFLFLLMPKDTPYFGDNKHLSPKIIKIMK